MFTTKRLTLRAVLDSDYEKLLKLFNTESVMRGGANGYLIPWASGQKEVLERLVKSSTMYTIIETREETPLFVGFARLDITQPKNRDAEFGIMLMPEFWGKGYGTEVTKFVVNHAFVELGAHRVSLWTFSHNASAMALYKKM